MDQQASLASLTFCQMLDMQCMEMDTKSRAVGFLPRKASREG